MPPADGPPGHPDYRFTLANERTLLAWLRTGLALVVGGVAVASYVPSLGATWGGGVVGLALVATGAGTALTGYARWRGNERAIGEDRPLPGGRATTALVTAVALVVLLVGVLLAVEVTGR